ncbi:hypothetical protein BD309DRAFT_194505 [Dichomitus squalens]|nr:hypothetical protein BD309DRAFT_194505 [Dichomitus squalens]
MLTSSSVSIAACQPPLTGPGRGCRDAPESICYAHLNVGNASSVSDLVYGSALPDMKACRPFGRISKKADATAEMADLIYYTLTELEKVCLRGSAQSSNRLSISSGGSPYGIETRKTVREYNRSCWSIQLTTRTHIFFGVAACSKMPSESSTFFSTRCTRIIICPCLRGYSHYPRPSQRSAANT